MVNPVLVAARGKGVPSAMRRAGVIARRYGIGPAKMDGCIEQMVSILGRYSCQPTLPITASVAERNRGLIDSYAARGVEFAIHGYLHVDHTRLCADDLNSQLDHARNVLLSFGLAAEGFRAPYLRADDRTLVAMRGAGFAFDSSQAVHWPVAPERVTHSYRRALEFYGAVSAEDVASLPSVHDGLVRIPYCLPDDEAVVDRLHLSAVDILTMWLGMLDATHERGELLTLGLHPERIQPCALAIAGVLGAARSCPDGVWIARLGQIAHWWRERAHATLTITSEHPCAHRVVVDGPIGLVLHVTDGEGRAVPYTTAGTEHRGSGLRQVLVVETPNEPVVEFGRWPDGARSALAVSGDVDALTIRDYTRRFNGS